LRLRRLRADWEHLGATDAHWAVLSDPAKRGGKWDVDEFYGSGRSEIDYVMSYVDQLRPGLRRGAALDFGCGPGRLTYALGAHFESVVGVDISAAMLALAEQHAGPSNCEFVRNERADLSLFGDERFDFVYSRIVLQHIPTQLAREYVREYVRVLKPDGLALFQIPVPATGPAGRVRRELTYRLRSRRDEVARIRIYGAAREDVEADVRAAGGHLLNVAPDRSAGDGYTSWLYAVTKQPGEQGVVANPPEWRTP
jgi:SAM-dependent methyltransferase